MTIATKIGLRNFSDGLAIGQSFDTGAIRFAIVLIIGFASTTPRRGLGLPDR